MVRLRAAKVDAIVQDVPDVIPAGDPDGDLLLVGWGSTYGAITAALRTQREKGLRVGHVHLRHLNPLPRNLGEVLKRYRKVVVPEMNMGQLSRLVRAEFLTPTTSLKKVQGLPFSATEIENKILEMLDA
jgi:2-oxoglutarate ferredoxin oxidoreductase subunit alpha